ncbi:metal-dependent transcriptional regulator [Anaerocolumna xylanovorans]|uniref:Manganese transport regulator n=1 Tax=Anaerocolumna xylanovorans DSM 12503 TaxID=1121345 RepID=A0A1M7Y9C7_9FIRM|nr:iron dependent repressor, metal binding and dimerization domain protein [Anaerocolumna xylanovorans]SHO49166.1 iron (metal) dependent repressor, DtxR family [Anaerocolumna xylanovorans DSM 12503]
MSDQEFYTFREYLRTDHDDLSPSAEDYLEMIYRLSKDSGYTRAGDLAQALNVQPPSVTSMVKKLAEMSLLKYEKYGVIILEPNGLVKGKALLCRHDLVENFLKFLNIKSSLLEETEKIEHTLNDEILTSIRDLLDFFQSNKAIEEEFAQFRKRKHP